MPGRHQKDKPPQREHRRSGVTKQYAGRRPEPVSPAGNPQTEDAPKGNAATLRPTTDALLSIRFRGSMRELFFGEISPVWRGENSPKNSRIEPLKPQASQVVDNQGCYLEVHGEGVRRKTRHYQFGGQVRRAHQYARMSEYRIL